MAIAKFKTTLRSTLANDIVTAVDAGVGAGTLKVYTASMPASPDVALSGQTLLGTLTFSDPCGTVTNGVLTFSTITQDDSADATGTAAWARAADSTGAAVADFDITATGGGGVITMNTVSIVELGPIAMTSFSITVGA